MKYVLFVCTHNAGRSQMAQALFERHAPATSAPSPPASSPPTGSGARWSRRWARSASTCPAAGPRG